MAPERGSQTLPTARDLRGPECHAGAPDQPRGARTRTETPPDRDPQPLRGLWRPWLQGRRNALESWGRDLPALAGPQPLICEPVAPASALKGRGFSPAVHRSRKTQGTAQKPCPFPNSPHERFRRNRRELSLPLLHRVRSRAIPRGAASPITLAGAGPFPFECGEFPRAAHHRPLVAPGRELSIF